MRKIIRIFDSVLAVFCCVIMAFVAYGSYTMPNEIVRYNDSVEKLSPVYSYTVSQSVSSVNYQGITTQKGSVNLLGVIPVKSVKVSTAEAPCVYVSGEVFGIKLYTDGVIVVGTQSVDTKTGKKINPAEEAGIETGDVIVSVNGVNVYSSTDVTDILNDNNGEEYVLKIKRDGRYKTFTLTPEYSLREGCYKAGMWVRDSTAGIGTITFYNEGNGTFAALGHQVNDVDTNELMPLLRGEAVSARVTKVQKGTGGATGSLWCDFESRTMGILLENTECGLYGSYSSIGDCALLYEVAAKQETQKGYAQIISTVDEGEPKAYDIEITKISYNKEDEQKDIVFRVTDEELLEKTGGIVQGMSGSPIIQNGKLIGAVTHVIVDSPEKGYAVFAETMYKKSQRLDG